MSKDLTVVLQDRPGELARLGQATGEAGVNIQGMCAFTGEGRGIIHLLVDDAQAAVARQALEDAGMGVADEREVLVVDIEDRPGHARRAGPLAGRGERQHRARLHDLRRRQARDRHRRPRQRPRRAGLKNDPASSLVTSRAKASNAAT